MNLFYLNNMPRISVDIVYMQMAYQTAKLSYAERRRVGCIIVKDEQIVSFGYNGTPHGFDNTCESASARIWLVNEDGKITHTTNQNDPRINSKEWQRGRI